MLLWLRTDWIENLGLEEPRSMDEAMDIIRAFVEEDVSGGGQTVGLACSTEVIAGSSDTYGVDGIFTKFGSSPEKWILEKAEYTMGRFARMYGMEYLGMASSHSKTEKLGKKL